MLQSALLLLAVSPLLTFAFLGGCATPEATRTSCPSRGWCGESRVHRVASRHLLRPPHCRAAARARAQVAGREVQMQTTTITKSKPLFNLDRLKVRNPRSDPSTVCRLSPTQHNIKAWSESVESDKSNVERYQLFPAKNMSESLDFMQCVHEGGPALRRLYHESDKVVVVKYYKSKCSMCRVLQPLMDKVVSEFQDRVHFVQLEVTLNRDVIIQAGLIGIPTTHVFYRGMLVDHFSGLLSKRAMRELLAACLATYEHMPEASVHQVWLEKKREFALEEEEEEKEEARRFMQYPIKGIMAPGRVLAPVHWNNLFDRGGHSLGIAGLDRLGRAPGPFPTGRLIEQFLDNQNCQFDATYGSAFTRALQKSDVVSSKQRRRQAAWLEDMCDLDRDMSRPPPITHHRLLAGRIADGESNLHFLPAPQPWPSSTNGAAPASNSPLTLSSASTLDADGWASSASSIRDLSVELCDETGCAMIYE